MEPQPCTPQAHPTRLSPSHCKGHLRLLRAPGLVEAIWNRDIKTTRDSCFTSSVFRASWGMLGPD